MKTIVLHGALKKFGKYFKLDVASAYEATHALACQMPAFREFMLQSKKKGLGFAVFVGNSDKTAKSLKRMGKNIGEDELKDITNASTIHIVPQIIGAGGNGGFMQILTGAALIGAAFFTGGASMAAWGAMSTSLFSMGVGMMIGGLTSLLMPTPKLDSQDQDGNKANYGFGGAVTTVAQGNPVPILYGERDVGGFICSAGIYTEDLRESVTTGNKASHGLRKMFGV
ncbi:phage tail protein [Moraxella caviae]|uniref:Phage tail protein n=1 Tax=Moraxella caviae TaxID=34060 RepID=A0A1T0A3G3_9GAMM|nr:tail assembly protein [Moraxella caviae]OOR90235.1 phage tail protein [Moraxella caviae]STZ14544.1 Phage-related protein, tail component [Moraxella caviae]VEW12549.1 Phage-related protein, tail component [Moraxella caviae]